MGDFAKALSVASIAAALAGGRAAAVDLVTYDAPSGETLSADYQVHVNSHYLSVYKQAVRFTNDTVLAGQNLSYGGAYSFASFDFNGQLTVKINSTHALDKCVIRPAWTGTAPALAAYSVTLILDKPGKWVIEPDGKHAPLLLFANPLEINAPKSGDANVIYYGPGIYKENVVQVKSGQTLYLAGGAILHAAVNAVGDNIRIAGRGILDGNDWPHIAGPASHMLNLTGRNMEVTGITLRGSWGWTLVADHCDSVRVANVKICNGRVENDDGIDIVNSSHVTVDSAFVRSDDDCVAMKGMNADLRDVDGVTVRNSLLWTDRARILLLGHESRAKHMQNILIDNDDILHYVLTPLLLEPGEEMWLQHSAFTNLRINADGKAWNASVLIALHPTVNQYMVSQVPGHILDLRFKDIALTGVADGDNGVWAQGPDSAHRVQDVAFENLTRFGQTVLANSAQVNIAANTRNITFAPASAIFRAPSGSRRNIRVTASAPFRFAGPGMEASAPRESSAPAAIIDAGGRRLGAQP